MDGVVTLEWYEQNVVRHTAAWRQKEAETAGLADRYGAADDPASGMRLHVNGAGGEMALAKYLGIYWDCSVNTFHAKPDVGPYHVRTRSKHHYDLIVRPSDPFGLYVLVTGELPEFHVRGYFDTANAEMDESWWRDYGGHGHAWFIPQDALRPLGTGWGALVA